MLMYRLRLLAVLFSVFVILTLLFSAYPPIAAMTAFLSILILAAGLFQFLSQIKTKKIGGIKIEEVTFVRNFVFRSYVKSKDVWVVFDKKTKTFRNADFRELPLKSGMTTLVGLGFLYVSYLILSTLFQFTELLVFRSAVLIIFLTIGIYSFFIGLVRMASIKTESSIKLCKILNKSTALKNLVKRHNISFEITPNFLLWNGFVTSVEFVSSRKLDTKPIEKFLVQISRVIEKTK